MPQKIFISYRREDAGANALGISQYLEKEFGRKNVFIDVDMRAGAKFPAVLEERLAECKVMLVLIGPEWLNSRSEDGQRRIDLPDDWVRLEIAQALKRDITVIPVRVNGAMLPLRERLPEDIRGLLDHQAVSLTLAGFRHEMSGLVRDIRAIPSPRPWRRFGVIAAGFAVLLAALAGVWAFFHLGSFSQQPKTASPSGEKTVSQNAMWSASPGEWVLYAYDQNWVGYYFKRGSAKAFGDNVTYLARYSFKPIEPDAKSERPLGAYQDDRLVFDCKRLVYVTAETTTYNKAGEILSHFKRAEPEAMDMSTAGVVPPGSILSLAQHLMCNEQLKTPLAEQIKRAKLTYLTANQEADLFYDKPQKSSESPGQFEVLVVSKYFQVHSYPDITNGHPIVGIPGSFNVEAQRTKVSCTDRTMFSPKLEYYDSDNNLIFINAIPNIQPIKIVEGKPMTFLFNIVCGGQVPQPPTVSGIYEGTIATTYKKGGQGEQKFAITIEQTGNDLKVAYKGAAGAEGKGAGTFENGTANSISLQSTTPGCPGSYEASFKFADDSLTWSFKGEDCGGPMEGNGTAKKVKA